MSKQTRKNSKRCTDEPAMWNVQVWNAFATRMDNNKTSQGKQYFVSQRLLKDVADDDVPPALRGQRCHNPAGSNNVMLCFNSMEYQRPLHRLRFLLKMRANGVAIPKDSKTIQASHLCMNEVNADGRGVKQCCNPAHMVAESDKDNKSRQRCAGWIWIHPHQGNAGGYWYPSCTHQPPCLRFVPKAKVPSQLE